MDTPSSHLAGKEGNGQHKVLNLLQDTRPHENQPIRLRRLSKTCPCALQRYYPMYSARNRLKPEFMNMVENYLVESGAKFDVKDNWFNQTPLGWTISREKQKDLCQYAF